VIEVMFFRVPLLHGDDRDVVGHIARHYC
jgi:hypothetical protein